MTNEKKLFYGSCFALITTALSFSLRAGVLPQIQGELGLSAEQLGYINQMWFLGFPISMVIGGLVYHTVGGKRIMLFAFAAHMIGIIMTIYSGSYIALMISTLLIGLGNGCTEAACNPMIADTYEGNMTYLSVQIGQKRKSLKLHLSVATLKQCFLHYFYLWLRVWHLRLSQNLVHNNGLV